MQGWQGKESHELWLLYYHAGDNWGPPGPIRGHRGGCHDAERQQLVGAICLRSLEGPRASNATSQCWGETDSRQDYGQDAVHRVHSN